MVRNTRNQARAYVVQRRKDCQPDHEHERTYSRSTFQPLFVACAGVAGRGIRCKSSIQARKKAKPGWKIREVNQG
jgi:hypothetical protein